MAQSNEHMRNWTEKGWKRSTGLGNYYTTREHLNFEVVSGVKIRPIDKGRSIPERMAELLHKRGIKDPNEEMCIRDRRKAAVADNGQDFGIQKGNE